MTKSKKMTGALLASMATTVLGSMAVIGAPLAFAFTSSEVQFVSDVTQIGIHADNEQDLVSVGWGICNQLRQGATVETVANNLAQASDANQGAAGITPVQAEAEVNAAESDLCP